MEHFLDRLRSDLVRRHGKGVLREPVDRVAEQMGEGPGAAALRSLGTATDESLLGPVLESPAVHERFDEIGPAARSALHASFGAWSRDRQKKARASEGRISDVAEHELVSWARRLGVEERLDDPVAQIARFAEGGSWVADALRFGIAGDVRRAALGRTSARGIPPHELAAAARKYLEACAADAAQHARREMLWRQTPAQPALARLAESLRRMEMSLRTQNGGIAARVGRDAVTLDASVPCLSLGRTDETWDGRELKLVLAGHEQGELAFEPPHPSPRRALALVRVALDAVHDSSNALHAPLTEALAMPTWKRLVESIEEELIAADEREVETRVVFRVAMSETGAPVVDVAEQRRGARGRWTKGSRITPGAALASKHPIGPAEALALRALGDMYRPSASAEALFALVGRPDVVSERGAPLEVRRVEARFALADEVGGVRPALALGEARIPVEIAATRVRDASCVAHVMLERGLVLVAAIDRDLSRLVLAASRHSAVVPDAERAAILPLVERVAARVPVTLSAALEREVAPLAPVLFVRIVPDESGASVEIRTRLSPSTSASAGVGATLVSVLGDGTAEPVLRRRDLGRELHDAHELARAIGLPEEQTHAHLATEDELLSLIAALHAHPDVEVEWPEDTASRARYVGAIGRGGLRVSVKSAAEWFGVDGEVEIDGEMVKLAELLAQVRAGRRFVRLSRGRFALIEADLRARLERAADVVFETKRGQLAVVPAAGDALESLADDGALRSDEAWSRIRTKLRTGALGEIAVPETLHATLRDYQRAGFAWLARLASVEAGAVLADDMGLGKTVQALALLAHRASDGPALVVAPTSLGDNWLREAERFAPSLRVRLHRGPARHAALENDPPRAGDVLIASYDVVALDEDALTALDFATLVLDEAQAIKNPEAQRTKAARALRARVRIALTGTPLENRLSELWSIVSVVHPGLLGPWEHFRARFAQPIEKDGDKARLAALSELVRPYLLRRTKEVVTPELPPRIELVRDVELSDAERRLYDAERTRAITALAGADESQRFRVLASITRLRELACDASLVVPDASVASSKLASLMELIDELEGAGRKVLVFSQFVRLLENAASLLRARKTSYLQLDGSTPAPERARRVEAFQRGEATVFLLSLKAGGTGLNLTAADTVVHLDPWWNPAVEDQASDRAHRIGQDKPVTIVRLVTKDTIEESVLALHATKRELTRGVLEGADAAGALSAVELVDLIRGGVERDVRRSRTL
ncbi:Hypothetical protein I5071_72060 [Sandaracinus amylolyticus]|nr:Hypothetical protein I5071_72060 [Sandaracinus amylolyticus]